MPDDTSENAAEEEDESKSEEATTESRETAQTAETLKELSSGRKSKKVSLPSSPSPEPYESPLPVKSSWFRSKEAKRLYFEKFESKSVVPCDF